MNENMMIFNFRNSDLRKNENLPRNHSHKRPPDVALGGQGALGFCGRQKDGWLIQYGLNPKGIEGMRPWKQREKGLSDCKNAAG